MLNELKRYSRTYTRNLYRSVSKSWKRKRFMQFLELVKPSPSETILDLGGAQGTFFHDNMDLVREYNLKVVIADIKSDDLMVAEKRGFSTYLMQEDELSGMESGAFDVVFCNSVIEHVTIPKNCVWDSTGQDFYEKAYCTQRAFAADIERISKKFYVQTPCVNFPIESHSWLPSFYAYPKDRDKHVKRLKMLNKYWIKSTVPDFNLLNEKQFADIFPSATAILCNRVLGFPKELIAYRS